MRNRSGMGLWQVTISPLRPTIIGDRSIFGWLTLRVIAKGSVGMGLVKDSLRTRGILRVAWK